MSPYRSDSVAPGAAVTSSVADSNSSQQLLAASNARLGFRIYNDSTVDLYIKFGADASVTDYTVKMGAGGYFEENFYCGRVDGIWASDASGSARVTSLTES